MLLVAGPMRCHAGLAALYAVVCALDPGLVGWGCALGARGMQEHGMLGAAMFLEVRIHIPTSYRVPSAYLTAAIFRDRGNLVAGSLKTRKMAQEEE